MSKRTAFVDSSDEEMESFEVTEHDLMDEADNFSGTIPMDC
jgi:hypothetical protein